MSKNERRNFFSKERVTTTFSQRFSIPMGFQTFAQTHQNTQLSCIMAIKNSTIINPWMHKGNNCCINKWKSCVFTYINFLFMTCPIICWNFNEPNLDKKIFSSLGVKTCDVANFKNFLVVV